MVKWREPRPVTRPRWVKRVEIDGHKFDSAGEGRRYQELKLLERAGRIRNLEIHPKLPMVINGKKIGRGWLTLDFKYEEGTVVPGGKPPGPMITWETIYEDYKPVVTRDSKTRRQVAEAIHAIQIRITTHTRRT